MAYPFEEKRREWDRILYGLAKQEDDPIEGVWVELSPSMVKEPEMKRRCMDCVFFSSEYEEQDKSWVYNCNMYDDELGSDYDGNIPDEFLSCDEWYSAEMIKHDLQS